MYILSLWTSQSWSWYK